MVSAFFICLIVSESVSSLCVYFFGLSGLPLSVTCSNERFSALCHIIVSSCVDGPPLCAIVACKRPAAVVLELSATAVLAIHSIAEVRSAQSWAPRLRYGFSFAACTMPRREVDACTSSECGEGSKQQAPSRSTDQSDGNYR